MRGSPSPVRWRRRALRLQLALTIGILLVAHYALLLLTSGADVGTAGALSWLDLFQERSVGTWVNAMLLAAVALTAAAFARPRSASRTPVWRGWHALAALVALASIDEVAGLHESVVGLVRSAVDLPEFLHYAAWVPPAIALLVAFIASQRRFFSLLPRWLARRIAAAAGVYVSAAAGLEMVESEDFAARGGKEWTAVLQGPGGPR
jgi:hypothetical protein